MVLAFSKTSQCSLARADLSKTLRPYSLPTPLASPFSSRCLSYLGILLARSLRPCPWRHVPVLKALVHDLHSDPAVQGDIGHGVWAPARRFFELPKARLADLGVAGAWHRWSDGGADDGGDGYEPFTPSTLHLPHLLHVLGPSSLARYNHVLGRRRILIYSQPPVEAACFVCQVAADMCLEEDDPHGPGLGATPRLKGKHREGINVLGMVTPHDIDTLEHESRTGGGWITCTTAAAFLEKSQHYDLIIDLISYAPADRRSPDDHAAGLAARPQGAWTELDHILQLDADTNGVARARHASALVWTWTDAWRVYEDVCVVRSRLYSGLWRSCSSNGPSGPHDQWAGSPRERSAARLYMRTETSKGAGRCTARTMSTRGNTTPATKTTKTARVLVRSRQMRTILALLQTFYAQTRFLLSRLATVLPDAASSLSDAQLTPRDLLTLALGPLSSPDAQFVERLAEKYAGGARVSVRRGWRDLLGGLVGAAVGGSGAASSS
ncbi:hypothetical protein EDB89DRAFT_2073835 [Lactarius sanguifluus]|nr:hypothetical protein EDB89DRAFT_2073835 [Lactarius sanguifluus]